MRVRTSFAVAIVATIAVAASAQTFPGGALTIPTSGVAAPYPSIINVAGLGAPITQMTVAINDVSHTFPDDFGILLQGPNGNTVVLEDGAWDGTPAVALNWVFDDAAGAPMPNTAPAVSGTFKPGQNQYNDLFTAPAAASGSWLTSFAAAFGGSNGNGPWRLFVQDFVGGDGGSIGSWSITFVPEPATLSLLAVAGLAALRRRR
ncbi:MAG: PEP-CTERM sorting domain-containing protein [Phycisphaerae bacterium]